MDEQSIQHRRSRPRNRPNGQKEMPAALSNQEVSMTDLEGKNETNDGTAVSAGGPKPFSILLSFLIKNDRSEILRLAREIGVSDNTVYRWINGTSEPRPGHMQRLL